MQRRPPSPRELIAVLLACAKSPDSGQELKQFLAAHGHVVATALGSTVDELQKAVDLQQPERLIRCRTLVKTARERGQTVHVEAMRKLALAAAATLSELARWHEDHIELDHKIVLGKNLLADSSKKYLRFDADGFNAVTVKRAKLREASSVLKFKDLTASLEPDALCFGWRGGIGGLRLTSQEVERKDRDAVLHVVLSRCVEQVAPMPAAATYTRPVTWVADVFDAMGPL